MIEVGLLRAQLRIVRWKPRPGWKRAVRPLSSILDASNYSPDNLLRSAMESAVYGLRAGLDTFRELGCEIQEIRLTGGGSRSAIWRQMVADIFNLPVTVQMVASGCLSLGIEPDLRTGPDNSVGLTV